LAVHLVGLTLLVCGCKNSGAAGTAGTRAKLFPNPPEEDARRPPDPLSPADRELAAGTPISLEISDVIDSDTSMTGLFVHGRVVADVMGTDGKVAVPARSSGVIAVLSTRKDGDSSSLSLALYQLTLGDRSYLLNRGTKQLARLEFTEQAANGPGHRSVHLESHSVLKFTVSESIVFKH